MTASVLAAWSWFTGTTIGRAVLLAGAALAALSVAFSRGRASAVERERLRAAEVDLNNRRVRDEVDRSVAARPDPAADLLRDWRRD